MAGKGKNGVKGERIKRNPSPQPKYLNGISPSRHESSDSQDGTKKAVGTVQNEAQGTATCDGETENGSITQPSQDNEAGGDGLDVSGAPAVVVQDENDNGYTSGQVAAQALTLSGYLAELGILSNEVTEGDREDEEEHDLGSLFVSLRSDHDSWKASLPLDPALISANSTMHYLRNRNNRLINSINTANAELEELCLQIRSQDANEAEIEDLKSRVNGLSKKLSLKEDILSAMSEDMETLRKTKHGHDTKLLEMENEYNAKLEKVEKERDWALDQLRKRYEESVKAHSNSRNYHDQQGEKLMKGATALREKIEEMKKDN